MILAAGRGERMRPLSDALPKPLLEVGGKPLIAWQLERLVAAGCVSFWIGAQVLILNAKEAVDHQSRANQ